MNTHLRTIAERSAEKLPNQLAAREDTTELSLPSMLQATAPPEKRSMPAPAEEPPTSKKRRKAAKQTKTLDFIVDDEENSPTHMSGHAS